MSLAPPPRSRRVLERTRSLAAALFAFLVACRGSSPHTGTGEVVTLEPPAHLTIDHDEIPGVMPAARTRFAVRTPDVLAGVEAGTRVRFEIVREGGQVLVTRVIPQEVSSAPTPGIHDH